jgi:hypothetical protein
MREVSLWDRRICEVSLWGRRMCEVLPWDRRMCEVSPWDRRMRGVSLWVRPNDMWSFTEIEECVKFHSETKGYVKFHSEPKRHANWKRFRNSAVEEVMNFYRTSQTSESVGKIDYESFRVRCRYKMEWTSGFTWGLWSCWGLDWVVHFHCRQKP